jgi:hypothetical protein
MCSASTSGTAASSCRERGETTLAYRHGMLNLARISGRFTCEEQPANFAQLTVGIRVLLASGDRVRYLERVTAADNPSTLLTP